MADAPKILGTDTLRQAYPKLNSAIDNSNEALKKSDNAVNSANTAISEAQRLGNEAKSTANAAETKADSVQEQFNQVVIEGDSSVEAAQARERANGTSFTTLRDRLNYSDVGQIQTDFVQLIKDRVGFSRGSLKKINSTMFEVTLEDGNKHTTYRFTKDTQDDFRKLSKVYTGDVGDFIISGFDATTNDISGTWNQTSLSSTNWYTQDKTTPATFTGYVTGEKITFMSLTDDRGGVWEFIVDDDQSTKKQISTFSPTAQYNVSHVVAEGLENKEHKVFAKFIGDDPNNPPSSGAGTSRGWLYSNVTEPSYNTLSGNLKIGSIETKRLLVDGSNKEFAFNALYNGTQNWLPQHGEDGTVFYNAPVEYYVDGAKIDLDSEPNNSAHVFYGNAKVIQDCICRINGVDIAKLKITHSFNMDGGCKWNGRLEALTSFTIVDGYPLMLPLANETFDKIVSGIYTEKISAYNDSVDYFNLEGDIVESYVAVDPKSPNHIVACKIDNKLKSMRLDRIDGKRTLKESVFLSERADFPKLYYIPLKDKNMSSGEVYTWAAQMIGAEIKDAIRLIY